MYKCNGSHRHVIGNFCADTDWHCRAMPLIAHAAQGESFKRNPNDRNVHTLLQSRRTAEACRRSTDVLLC